MESERGRKVYTYFDECGEWTGQEKNEKTLINKPPE